MINAMLSRMIMRPVITDEDFIRQYIKKHPGATFMEVADAWGVSLGHTVLVCNSLADRGVITQRDF